MLVKRLTAVMLLAVFGLAVPVAARAQADNDAARIAVQKHNARRSEKQVKARQRSIRKTQKAMAKRAHAQNKRQKHSGTTAF